MSRQLEVKSEERTARRQLNLVRALDFGIVGALESQGVDLVGMSIIIEPYNVLITLRADINGKRMIAYVGSDSLINAFLKAESAGLNRKLKWKACKYHRSGV